MSRPPQARRYGQRWQVETVFSMIKRRLGDPFSRPMLPAGVYRTWKYRADLTMDSAAIMLVGSLTAFVVALLVVDGFMKYIRTHRFTPFVVYRIVLGILVLIFARQYYS